MIWSRDYRIIHRVAIGFWHATTHPTEEIVSVTAAGSGIEYAGEITIARAMEGRRDF